MNLKFRIIFLPFLLFMGIMEMIAQDNSDNFNYDLPNLLVSNNGKRIQTIEEWEKNRRPEIIKLFETYVYGKIPEENIDISFKVIKARETNTIHLRLYGVLWIAFQGQ